MGWVRGQTGQKKERKAKERLPGAGVWRDPGQGDLGWAARQVVSRSAAVHLVGEEPNRRPPPPDCGTSGGVEGGGGAGPSCKRGGRRGEGRARGAGVLKGSRAQGCTNGLDGPAP